MASSRLLAASAAAVILGGLTSLPLLAVPAGAPSSCSSVPSIDGSPTILGPATLDAAELLAWWEATGRPQPPRLQADVADVIRLYISEGQAEGVRGDIAFAQAVLETGHFTNSDTTRHNFAGIAHYDRTPSGQPFPNVRQGVRAHMQLLRKFASGNDVELARPDVAPDAGAMATTWAHLAGTWATDPQYWSNLSSLYGRMLAHSPMTGGDGTAEPAPACPPSARDVVGSYALPVHRSWYEEHPIWFTKPHHDYPAADLPVPSGTPIYAVAAGSVVSTTDDGRCGTGVLVNGDDGAQYTYCHGIAGAPSVAAGDRVEAGQQLMLSGNTGNSTGPHLHFGIRVGGQQRCPQNLFVAIADGRPPDVTALPSSGCSY